MVSECDARLGHRRKGKKACRLTRSGRVGVAERAYQWQGRQVLPFSADARVRSRSLSLGLQRALVDFGADSSFAAAVKKVREHYGVEVTRSAARSVTQAHGAAMQLETEVAVRVRCSAATPRRWAVTSVPGGSGKRVSPRRVRRARTRLHCVGDGARWVVGQVTEQFGAQATFLVDFYHLSDYLAAAIKGVAAKSWLWQQQERMKANQVAAVLAELAQRREAESVEDVQAPVRNCLRYLVSRLDYLDHQGAIGRDRPIGSGEEAEKMLALRVMRTNSEWQSYWRGVRQAHA